MTPPPPDPAVELVVAAPPEPAPPEPGPPEPEAAAPASAEPPPASAPAEPAQEPPPETVAQPAPPPPQPDAAAAPPAAAAALPALPPPVRAPAIRTRSELRRILTPPPAQHASDAEAAPALNAPAQDAPARDAPAQATAGPGPQAAEARAAASASAAEATFEGRVRDAIQAALRVPQAARLMGLSGRARVRLGYRDGSLTSASLDLSAGSPLLDDAALRAAREAAYPSPPAELQHRLLTYLVWVRIDVR